MVCHIIHQSFCAASINLLTSHIFFTCIYDNYLPLRLKLNLKLSTHVLENTKTTKLTKLCWFALRGACSLFKYSPVAYTTRQHFWSQSISHCMKGTNACRWWYIWGTEISTLHTTPFIWISDSSLVSTLPICAEDTYDNLLGVWHLFTTRVTASKFLKEGNVLYHDFFLSAVKT